MIKGAARHDNLPPSKREPFPKGDRGAADGPGRASGAADAPSAKPRAVTATVLKGVLKLDDCTLNQGDLQVTVHVTHLL